MRIMKLYLVPLLLLCMIAAREWISCEASRKMSSKGVEAGPSGQTYGVPLLFSRRILAKDEEESNDMESELMLSVETDARNLEVTTEVTMEEESKAVQSEQNEPMQKGFQVEKQQAESLMEEKQVKIEEEKVEKQQPKEKELKSEPSGDTDLESASVTKGSDEEKSGKKIVSETKRKSATKEKVLKSEAEAFIEQKSSDDKTVEKLQEEGKELIKTKKEVKEDMEESSSSRVLEDKAVKEGVMAEEAKDFPVEVTPADESETEMQGGVEALVSKVVEEENGEDMDEEKLQPEGEKGSDLVDWTPRKRQGSADDSKQAKGENVKEKPSKERKEKHKTKVKAQVLEEEMEVKGFNPDSKELGPATKAKQGGKNSSESVLGSELVEEDLDAKVEEKLETKAGEIFDLQSEQLETQNTAKTKAKGKKKKENFSEKAKKEEKPSAMEIQSLDKGTEEGTKSNGTSTSKPIKVKEGNKPIKVKAPDPETKSEIVDVVDMSTKSEEVVTKGNQTKVQKPSKGTQKESSKTQKQEEIPDVEVLKDKGTEEGTESNATSPSKPTKVKEKKRAPDLEPKSEIAELVDMSTETEEIVTKHNQTKVQKPSKRTQDEHSKTPKQEEMPKVDIQAPTEGKVSTKEVSEEAQQSEEVVTKGNQTKVQKPSKETQKRSSKTHKQEEIPDVEVRVTMKDKGTEEGTKSNATSPNKPTKVKEGKRAPDLEPKSEIAELVDMSTETEEIVTKHNQTEVQKPSKRTQDEHSETPKQEEMPKVEVQAPTEGKVSTKEVSEEAQQSEVVQESFSSSVPGSDEEEYGDFMQDFVDIPSKIQDTAQKVADHLGPNIQKITDTSKVYFNKANQQITESFSPLVGKQFAPLLASLISYGLLLVPLVVVILLFEHIRALLSIQKVLLFVNIYLAAYFVTLLLTTFIIGEPMTFFYKSSASGYIHLQLLQALAYIIYLVLQTFDLVFSCSSETLPVKVTVVLQWFVAFMIGFHYYVTVFHRAMALKGPHTSWKIYGIYSMSFFILCLFARIKRTKKGYSRLGDIDMNKKN